MLSDVSPPPVDILLLDSQVNKNVINNRKNIFGMILLIIMKSTHHPTNKKPHLESMIKHKKISDQVIISVSLLNRSLVFL